MLLLLFTSSLLLSIVSNHGVVGQDCIELINQLVPPYTTNCQLTKSASECLVMCQAGFTGVPETFVCDGTNKIWIGANPNCISTDSNPPVFTKCPQSETLYPAAGENSVHIEVEIEAVDDIDGILYSQTNEYDIEIGQRPFAFTFKDASQNEASCNFVITVVDNELPEIICPSNITFLSGIPDSNNALFGCIFNIQGEQQFDSGIAALVPEMPNDVGQNCVIDITDNDDILTYYLAVDGLQVSSAKIGTYPALFVAKDVSGNEGVCESEISVVFNQDAADSEKLDEARSSLANIDASSLSDAQLEAALDNMALLTASLDAEDDEGINLVANVLGSIASSSSSLSIDSRQSVSSTALDLALLRKQKLERVKAARATETCGNAVCNSLVEHCGVCSSDCDGCSSITSSSTHQIVGQWQSGATGYGISNFSVEATPEDAVFTVSFLSRTQLLTGGVDVYERLPIDHTFLGTSFSIQGVNESLTSTLTLSVASLSRIIPPGSTLFLVDVYDASIVTCNNQPAIFSWISENLYETSFCGNGMFAVTTNTSVKSVEENLAFSVGVSIVNDNSSDAAAVNSRVFETIDTVSILMSDGLSVNDPPVTLETASLSLQSQRSTASDLAAQNMTFGNTTVDFPDTIGSILNSSEVTLSFSVFNDNPFTWGNQTAEIATAVFDITFRDEDGAIDVNNLTGGNEILLSFPFDADAPYWQRQCQYWDPDAIDPDCLLPEDDASCKGMWVTTGVTRLDPEDPENGTEVICVLEHLSSFSVGINFKISPPSISLANFGAKSKNIYIVMGAFLGLVLIAVAFSYFERWAYDRRQLKIVKGELEDDEIVELEFMTKPAPTTGWRSWYIPRMFFNFCHNVKTRHHFVSLFWPTGRKVYPKRVSKVLALVASTALSFGLDAVFAYTATVNTCEGCEKTVNTISFHTVWGDARLPMDGLYAFVISLPALIVLSIFLGKYSAYTDILRKVAPRRFRALNASLRQEMIARGLPLETYFGKGRKRLKKMSRQAYKEVKKVRKEERKAIIKAEKAKKKEEKKQKKKDKKLGTNSLVRSDADDVKKAWQEQQQAVDAISLNDHQDEDAVALWKETNIDEPTTMENGTGMAHLFDKADNSGEHLIDHEPDEAQSLAGSLNTEEAVTEEASLFSQPGVISPVPPTDEEEDQPLVGESKKRAIVWNRNQLGDESMSDDLVLGEGAFKRRNSLDEDDAMSDDNSMDIVLTKEAFSRTNSFDEEDELDDEELFLKQMEEIESIMDEEFNEATEELVDSMIKWRNRAVIFSIICFIGGFLMAFFWMGSLGEDGQRRWIEAFFTYEVISVFITAPLFIFIVSAIESRRQKKQLEKSEIKAKIEEEKKAAIIGYTSEGKPIYDKSMTTKQARKDAMEEVAATLQKELEKQLLTFNFF